MWRRTGTIFSYTDNGLGIESKHLENVFKPGFVLDRDKGTGFGLAIIRKIVQAYGGKIWADSKGLGQGCHILLTVSSLNKPQILNIRWNN